MADNFPTRYDNPRVPQMWSDLSTEKIPWVHAPRFGWGCAVEWTDVNGEHATLLGRAIFAGTVANGDYETRFYDANGTLIAAVTTTRDTGSPATLALVAAQHELDIEAEADLADYITGASTASSTVSVAFAEGVVMRMESSAPGTATASNTHRATLPLNAIAMDQAFPLNVIRSWCLVHVTEEYPTGSTLVVGDAGDIDGILGSTPVDINALGRYGSVAADAEYQPRAEAAFIPVATIELGDDPVLAQGSMLVEILFTPNLVNTAA